MNWPLSRRSLVALCAILTTVVSLAVLAGGRDSVVRLTRGSVHRLDSADAPQDMGEVTLDSPSAPLLQPGPGQGHAVAPALVAGIVRLAPPSLHAMDVPQHPTSHLAPRSTRPSLGRAPPAL